MNKQSEQISALERTVHALSLQVQALCEFAQFSEAKAFKNFDGKNPKRKHTSC